MELMGGHSGTRHGTKLELQELWNYKKSYFITMEKSSMSKSIFFLNTKQLKLMHNMIWSNRLYVFEIVGMHFM